MFDFRSVFSFDASTASSKKQIYLGNKLEDFSEDESGIGTVWALFWLILCFSMGGLAIDATNVWKVHTILQSTADSAALAGVYELQARDDEGLSQSNGYIKSNAVSQADTYATLNMNASRYGDVLLPDDIHLGYWDIVDRTFTIIEDGTPGSGDYSDGPADAVRVITRQSGTGATSAVGTFFLRFVGFDRFTVATEAIASTFVSLCEYDGMKAIGKVKLSTGQRFYNEFCIHGEKGISAAHDNFFGVDVITSTPTFDLCGQSAGKCAEPIDGEVEQNPGLHDSWQKSTLFPDAEPVETKGGGKPTTELVGKPALIGEYIDSLLGVTNAEYVPEYIDNPENVVEIDLSSNKRDNGEQIKSINDYFAAEDMVNGFESGTVYKIICKQGTNVSLGPVDAETWDTISRVVIVGTNCDFVFDPSIKYYDIVIATDSTSQSTFSGPSGVTLGHHDGCDELAAPSDTGGYNADGEGGTYYGGAVTLLTQGSVHFASKLSAYDMEIIAAEDVHLASKAPTNKVNGRWVPIPVDELDESVHVGTTITTGGDISVSRAHEFNGCVGRVSSNLFDVRLSYRLVR